MELAVDLCLLHPHLCCHIICIISRSDSPTPRLEQLRICQLRRHGDTICLCEVELIITAPGLSLLHDSLNDLHPILVCQVISVIPLLIRKDGMHHQGIVCRIDPHISRRVVTITHCPDSITGQLLRFRLR